MSCLCSIAARYSTFSVIRQVRLISGQLDLGSGAGRGGGGGEAGDTFARNEAATEEKYFYNKQKEQLQKIKSDLHTEIGFHEEQIKRHQDAVARHRQRITEIDKH